MAKVEPVVCPRCTGPVDVLPSGGGRGTRDLTHYSADCGHCGMLIDHLSANGRKDSAIRDYNRWAGDEKAKLAGLPPPPKMATKMQVSASLNRTRSEFERGYFCAVSVLLREHGQASSDVRSLFAQGGDPTEADPFDVELFREHGLMA